MLRSLEVLEFQILLALFSLSPFFPSSTLPILLSIFSFVLHAPYSIFLHALSFLFRASPPSLFFLCLTFLSAHGRLSQDDLPFLWLLTQLLMPLHVQHALTLLWLKLVLFLLFHVWPRPRPLIFAFRTII